MIVDDHVVIRTGLKTLLSEIYPFAAIAEASDGQSMLEKLSQQRFDLVILDVRLPETDVCELLPEVARNHNVLVFTVCPEVVYGKRLLRAGAKGFLSKDASYAELKTAVRLVLSNRRYLSERMIDVLANDLASNGHADPFLQLSPRELEITNLLLSGRTVSDISAILNIQPSTVGTHKARIFEKLGISNLLELKDLATLNNFETA